ncbi:hypothetical protein E1B28_006970 [Marasmius oreades]|uniref:DUF6699 domain-containing protein n=1 Tax=Marasmius oreades TaxID=181124 RepID=A0A9P7UTA8_9AGAR|nr:uncharacterized protein E1B28_006970 [Marasmius oreades]KAG7093288.1 hypothetical protein E1B28_006970 [Marasmius oreades]
MQRTTSTTPAHHPSLSQPHTTQVLTLTSVMTAELSEPIEHQKTWEESGIARTGSHGAYFNTSEANSELPWPSATTTSTLPFQESHGSSSRVTELPPALSRSQCVRLPSQSDSETGVVLHSLLLRPMRAGIHWDLLESHGRTERVLKERWQELATHPALPSMTVVHPWLPWPITVHASGMDSRGVTVADVLLTISRNLRIPVDGTRRRIRISYLRGRRMFVGLKTSDIGGDIWELVVR